MKAIFLIILLSSLCGAMDKPLPQAKPAASELKKIGAYDVEKYIKKGGRLTVEDVIKLAKESPLFWDLFGRFAITNIKLVKPQEQASELYQPRSLVEQATQAVAQLPSKKIKNIQDPFIEYNLIIQRKELDVKAITAWLKNYIDQTIDNRQNRIMRYWNQIIERASVEQAQQILVEIVKPWLKDKKVDSRKHALATEMIEALVEYQCQLRDKMVEIFKEFGLLKNITEAFEDFSQRLPEISVPQLKRLQIRRDLIAQLLNNREACAQYCRDKIFEMIGLKK